MDSPYELNGGSPTNPRSSAAIPPTITPKTIHCHSRTRSMRIAVSTHPVSNPSMKPARYKHGFQSSVIQQDRIAVSIDIQHVRAPPVTPAVQRLLPKSI